MKEQLIKFLNSENISATKLADDIGVQRSSISHILSGRNKPSYDFIEKMLAKYPDLDADWLITGKGNMFKTVVTPKVTPFISEPDLFSSVNKKPQANTVNKETEKQIITEKTEKPIHENHVTNVNKVEKIVFFYSNGFFKEYSPSESNI